MFFLRIMRTSFLLQSVNVRLMVRFCAYENPVCIPLLSNTLLPNIWPNDVDNFDQRIRS